MDSRICENLSPLDVHQPCTQSSSDSANWPGEETGCALFCFKSYPRSTSRRGLMMMILYIVYVTDLYLQFSCKLQKV